ncbi:MAG: hypothetical protein RL228_1277, partial [Actinomycetota bacterium]
VARAIMDQLPNEELLYVADTERGPYGPRPLADVRAIAIEIMDWLVENKVKMVVIACNTASSAVLRDARERYSIPVIEVVYPAARRAASQTHNNQVGVIGTQATITSGSYNDAFAAAPQITLTTQSCPRFVEFVEAGITTGPELLAVAQEYLNPLNAKGIDTLVLGCTHYPLLTGVIQYVLGDDVTLVSSAEETAKDVYRTLSAQNLLREEQSAPKHRFIATGSSDGFSALGNRILGTPIVPEIHKFN